MQLPDSVKAIRARYVARFPVPQGSPGDAFEESARQWSIRFAEQVCFELGPSWGMKRADPNRPISKDTIALNKDGRLLIWDLLTGTGTGSPRLVDNPESEDVTGQTFVPVSPVDHLGAPVSSPPLVDLTAVGQKLDTLSGQIDALSHLVDSLGMAFNALDPTLRGMLQTQTENFAAVSGQIEALAARPVVVPDADLRVFGRVTGKVDFPNNG